MSPSENDRANEGCADTEDATHNKTMETMGPYMKHLVDRAARVMAPSIIAETVGNLPADIVLADGLSEAQRSAYKKIVMDTLCPVVEIRVRDAIWWNFLPQDLSPRVEKDVQRRVRHVLQGRIRRIPSIELLHDVRTTVWREVAVMLRPMLQKELKTAVPNAVTMSISLELKRTQAERLKACMKKWNQDLVSFQNRRCEETAAFCQARDNDFARYLQEQNETATTEKKDPGDFAKFEQAANHMYEVLLKDQRAELEKLEARLKEFMAMMAAIR